MKKTILIALAVLHQTALSAQNINIDSILLAAMDDKHVPGLAAMIIKNHQPAWVGTYGYARLSDSLPVTPNTSFMLASVSKTVVAAAIMNLYEEGLINLKADINTILPFDVFIPDYPDSVISSISLLTHTSSIADNWSILNTFYVFGMDSPVPLGEFLENYLSAGGDYYYPQANFYSYPPGEYYAYSNIGVALAAYLVEVVSGMGFDEYCQQKIFDPLCMDNTSWFISDLDTFNVAMPYHYAPQSGQLPNGYYCYPDYPDGQLRTSVLSLGKFLSMMMNNGSFMGKQILEEATVDTIFSQPVFPIAPAQGIIWYSYPIGGRKCWGHNGGDAGVSTNMYFWPDSSIGIITLANGNNFYDDEVLNLMFEYGLSLEPNPQDTFACSIPTAVASHPPAGRVDFFPNPVNSLLTLEKVQFPAWVEVSDATGKRMFRSEILQAVLDLSGLAGGVYVIRVSDVQGTRHSRFVKQ